MALDPSSVVEGEFASGEEVSAAPAASCSSGQQLAQPPPAAKRKRNPPGMPDPEAEVVALSPEALMATNRFVCEVCGKGFPRDQNLQLHRREHNLPWNLRGSGGGRPPRKRVYVCPVPTCVYHDPARALGDLTGIKKHFFRKHGGEKKYGCGSCSKKYAVLSDWQAHVRTCCGGAAGENSDGSLAAPVFRRKRRIVAGGAMTRNSSSKEQSTAKEASKVSNLGRPTSSPSQPVITPVFQLQQLPATPVSPDQQHQQQQQGQLVLAGYLLFYDCNPQAQGSTGVGK